MLVDLTCLLNRIKMAFFMNQLTFFLFRLERKKLSLKESQKGDPKQTGLYQKNKNQESTSLKTKP